MAVILERTNGIAKAPRSKTITAITSNKEKGVYSVVPSVIPSEYQTTPQIVTIKKEKIYIK
ncbi:hypothetical protein D3C71_1531850 [compost metagenome]